jgi:hypothetical protein
MNPSKFSRPVLVVLMVIAIAVVLALLTGCAAPPVVDYSKVDADKIKAIAQVDRGITVDCIVVAGIAGWGGGKTVRIQNDKGSAPETSVATDDNCNVTITTLPKAPVPAVK